MNQHFQKPSQSRNSIIGHFIVLVLLTLSFLSYGEEAECVGNECVVPAQGPFAAQLNDFLKGFQSSKEDQEKAEEESQKESESARTEADEAQAKAHTVSGDSSEVETAKADAEAAEEKAEEEKKKSEQMSEQEKAIVESIAGMLESPLGKAVLGAATGDPSLAVAGISEGVASGDFNQFAQQMGQVFSTENIRSIQSQLATGDTASVGGVELKSVGKQYQLGGGKWQTMDVFDAQGSKLGTIEVGMDEAAAVYVTTPDGQGGMLVNRDGHRVFQSQDQAQSYLDDLAQSGPSKLGEIADTAVDGATMEVSFTPGDTAAITEASAGGTDLGFVSEFLEGQRGPGSMADLINSPEQATTPSGATASTKSGSPASPTSNSDASKPTIELGYCAYCVRNSRGKSGYEGEWNRIQSEIRERYPGANIRTYDTGQKGKISMSLNGSQLYSGGIGGFKPIPYLSQ